jgi:hypothetical protein
MSFNLACTKVVSVSPRRTAGGQALGHRRPKRERKELCGRRSVARRQCSPSAPPCPVHYRNRRRARRKLTVRPACQWPSAPHVEFRYALARARYRHETPTYSYVAHGQQATPNLRIHLRCAGLSGALAANSVRNLNVRRHWPPTPTCSTCLRAGPGGW